MLPSLVRPQWSRIARQTNALLYKNFLVFYKSALTTIGRALIFPLLVTVILCLCRTINSQQDLRVPNGIATTPTRVLALSDAINNSASRKLVFVRNGISNEALGPIIHGIASLPGMQHIQTQTIDDPANLYTSCRQSLHGSSDCFAAVVFEAYSDSAVNYTIALDSSLTSNQNAGNFVDDNSVTATHLLPLKWALDAHIGNFTTAPRPFLNPYSGVFGPRRDPFVADRQLVNSFWLNTIATFTAPLFILILIGVAYHLSTFVAMDRESSMSELMAAQTVTTVPRILSTLISFFVLYLPGMIVASILMTQLLFTHTNDAILVLLTILAGASTTVSSHFVASFFSKGQLAGLYASVFTFALALVTLSTTLSSSDKFSQVLPLALIFPPMTWVFLIAEIAAVEGKAKGFSLLSAMTSSVSTSHGDFYGYRLQILDGYLYAIFFLIQIVAYGFGTYLIEQRLWGVNRKFDRIAASSDIAVRVTNFSKTYTSKKPWYRPFKKVAPSLVAVNQLNLEVKKGSVTFLLGPNGGGKTTTLKGIAGMTSMDDESRLELNESGVVFGICPQHNVLWENLTVEENIKIWRKLKTAAFEDLTVDEDDVLAECDLIGKAKAKAKTLSGGQMRKLQLAISFVGGSKVCCIDEASSGLDPLSRRSIWNIIQKGHTRRTILVTTHFLDEADVLADHIAILYKGKLVCEGAGTSLKARFGNDYVIRSESDAGGDTMVWRTSNSAEATRKILELEDLSEDTTYDIVFPTLEDVFLKVTSGTAILERGGDGIVGTEEETTDVIDEKIFALEQDEMGPMDLEMGRSVGLIRQVYALLAKRYTLFLQKATWIAYGINVLIPIIVSAALYEFIHTKAPPLQTCQTNVAIMHSSSDSLKASEYTLNPIPGLEQSIPLGAQLIFFPTPYSVGADGNYTTVVGPASAWSGAEQDSLYTSSLSGLRIGPDSSGHLVGNNGSSSTDQDQLLLATRLFANSSTDLITKLGNVNGFEFVGFGIYAPTPDSAVLFYDASTSMLYINLKAFGLITNRVGSSSSNGAARAITASVRSMVHVESSVDFRSMPIAVLLTLSFVAAASIAIIYPAFEKINRVRALHYCNGVSPFALWLAYLLFDTHFIILQALIVWGLLFTGSAVWYEPGYLIGVFILFGIATYLGTYALSLFVKKAAFAIAAGVHIALFVLYLAAYIMNQSFGPAAHKSENYDLLQFSFGLSSPAANLARAFFVATNSFDVLCGKYGDADVVNGFGYARYGGVYVNLLIQIIFLITFLSIYEYGNADWIRRHITQRSIPSRLHYIVDSGDSPAHAPIQSASTVEKHTTAQTTAPDPILSVNRVSKFFGRTFATENISFSITPNSTLALLGGNGAGKTTMINMIRGELKPSYGDIHVDGVSVLKHARKARLRMGVCPQDDAVDNLTVEQTLRFYARVKGLRDVDGNADRVMEAMNIAFYRGLQVRALSGGTKRKLSVAIALLGNPPILLLDEPSTGQDAGAKRILWRALQAIRSNRAILLTTHSMEEAEALASNVAIMGTRMLAQGTLSELQETHGGAYCIRAIRRLSENGSGDEHEALVVEGKIKDAFERVGIRVRQYMDRYGQVEFKIVHERALLGRIMSVMEGLKGEVGANHDGGAAAAGSSAAASGEGRERILQDYTVTGPTLEEVFMNVAREAGGVGEV